MHKQPREMGEFISKRVSSTPPSGLRKFFDIASTMRDVISLGIGEPDFVTPAPIIRAGKHSLTRGETHYTSNSGLFELRQAISNYQNRLYGVEYDPTSEVLVSVGVSEAMYLTMTAILDPGDEVIVPEPCFVAYIPEIEFAGGVAVTVPSYVENDFQVSAEAIEAAITPRTKAIFIGYPCNPTGAILSKQQMSDIALLAEKYDLLVISDEIYSRLVYDVEHINFASLPNMKDRTILLNGFSKSHAMTGWRVGYACAHPDIIHAMRIVHQYTIMSAPTLAQVAAVTALEVETDSYVEDMRKEYDRRRRLIVSGFNTLGMDCFEPKGAFYAFPSIKKTGMTSDEFSMRLLYEQEVAMVPGDAFGTSGEGYVRAAYATSYEKIEEALNRLESFMRRHG